MMFSNKTIEVEVYKMQLASLDGSFNMEIDVTKAYKPQLLELGNPRYGKLIAEHPHLAGIVMDDDDDKDQLPIHLVLGAGDLARLKTETVPKVGGINDPVAELTKLGWVIYSPGSSDEIDVTMLTKTVSSDFERLCQIAVLGITDSTSTENDNVYEDFQQQLAHCDDGHYKMNLMWKPGCTDLPRNETGSKRRKHGLLKVEP